MSQGRIFCRAQSGGQRKRADSALDGLYFSVIQLKPPRFTLSILLHLATAVHRAHTPFNLLLPFNSLLHLHAVTGNVGDGFTCSCAGSRRGLLCHSSSRSDDVGFQMDGFQTKKGGLSGYYGDGANVNATGSSRTQSDGVRLPVITPGLRAHFKPHTRTLIHTSAPLL